MGQDDFDNGVNGATGRYLFPLESNQEIAEHARRLAATAPSRDQHQRDLRQRNDALRNVGMGPDPLVNPTDLAQAGWGLILPANDSGFSREALLSDDGLGLLIAWRKEQAGDRFRIFSVEPGWSKETFLKSQGAPLTGPVDPERGVPYYLLIAADPVAIAFEFQYQLDVAYAVGRVHFRTLPEYARYASSVVRAEKEQLARSNRVAFWGVRNSRDNASQLSTDKLVQPLQTWLSSSNSDLTVEFFKGDGADSSCPPATKDNLYELLCGANAPALLFTSSHGCGFPLGDPHQRDLQGALVTQEWSPSLEACDPEAHLFSADDVASDADLHGMITFHFACYGLGTPQFNDFVHKDGPPQLSETPFIARLPQRLLSHEKGGALAVVGYIDRTFTSSFKNRTIKQHSVFQSALLNILRRLPVGHALEFFNQEYSELATDCLRGMQDSRMRDDELAHLWTRRLNARNFVIFGDPAVRLAIAEPEPSSWTGLRPRMWLEQTRQPAPSPRPSSIGDHAKSEQSLAERVALLERNVQGLQQECAELRVQLQRNASPDEQA
jgi:hypothetical protein